jgi:hypothetical protein
VKSHGGLWARITDAGNLSEAWREVRRGHSNSAAAREYGEGVEGRLERLEERLKAGTYWPGEYRQFRIFDPKPRTISCAPIEDRVVHHALCNVIAPVLERSFTGASFACRVGYGTHRACARARSLAGRATFFCKMDVRNFFGSIEHGRLLGVLLPKFREREVRELVGRLVRHPVPGNAEGKGLPIGNLTSQWFANVFLNGFDHAALAGFGGRSPRGYVRYMDDFVLFADSKAEAWRLHDAAREWLREERGLEVKDETTVVAPVSEGVPFLGLRIWPGCWRLRRSRFLRTRRQFRKRVRQFAGGALGERGLAQCAAACEGGVRWFGFKGILEDLAPEEGSSSGSNRVKRGGCWNNNAGNCTSSNRNNNNPSNANNNNGFRLVSTMSEQTGFHSGPPVPRDAGDEHAMSRAASSASDRREGLFRSDHPDVGDSFDEISGVKKSKRGRSGKSS